MSKLRTEQAMIKKVTKTVPKAKLRIMNEISAAEAVKLFHAAMVLEYDATVDLYCVNPEGFPKDIAAKDFMESLMLYRQMWMDGIDSGPNPYFAFEERMAEEVENAAKVSDEDLEALRRNLTGP